MTFHLTIPPLKLDMSCNGTRWNKFTSSIVMGRKYGPLNDRLAIMNKLVVYRVWHVRQISIGSQVKFCFSRNVVIYEWKKLIWHFALFIKFSWAVKLNNPNRLHLFGHLYSHPVAFNFFFPLWLELFLQWIVCSFHMYLSFVSVIWTWFYTMIVSTQYRLDKT